MALQVACAAAAGRFGVLVAMNDSVHAARHVVKADSQLLGAFSSGPAGPVAQVRRWEGWRSGVCGENTARLQCPEPRPLPCCPRVVLRYGKAGLSSCTDLQRQSRQLTLRSS
jgi:L-asparaginase/Glu-tRNA(Gln) amidotransferase subunit D